MSEPASITTSSPRVAAALLFDRPDLPEEARRALARCIAWRRIPKRDAAAIMRLWEQFGHGRAE